MDEVKFGARDAKSETTRRGWTLGGRRISSASGEISRGSTFCIFSPADLAAIVSTAMKTQP